MVTVVLGVKMRVITAMRRVIVRSVLIASFIFQILLFLILESFLRPYFIKHARL